MSLRSSLIRVGAIWSGSNLGLLLLLNADFPGVELSLPAAAWLLLGLTAVLTAETAAFVTIVGAAKSIGTAGRQGRTARRGILGLLYGSSLFVLLTILTSWNLFSHGLSFLTASSVLASLGDLSEVAPFLTSRELINISAAAAVSAGAVWLIFRLILPLSVREARHGTALAVCFLLISAAAVRLIPQAALPAASAERIAALFQARTFPSCTLFWRELIFAGGPPAAPISVKLTPRYELDDYLSKIDHSISRKNVLLVSLESVRASELFRKSAGIEVMPVMKRLAEEGVNFTAAYAAGNESLYSMTAVVSGLDPLKYPRRDKFTATDYPLARIYDLASSTHHTAFISSSNENWQGMANITNSPRLEYFFNANSYQGRTLPLSAADNGMYNAVAKGKLKNTTLDDSTTTAELLGWLEQTLAAEDKKPFFATVVFQASHYPYQQGFSVPELFKPAELTDQETDSLSFLEYPAAITPKLLNRYWNGLAYDDALIEKIVRFLKTNGELEKTVIVIFGDHGELFHENGAVTHAAKLYNLTLHSLFFISGLD